MSRNMTVITYYHTLKLELETAINLFVKFYRTIFPSATFLPKLHMLEDHIISWMKTWRIGCKLMGEQGAESLLASFNNTERA
uniref:Uncharacterized protein n=1 Tax=Amphimedon queenslandica TaxID=400682 RepID=A0A1X7V342_AMPQE